MKQHPEPEAQYYWVSIRENVLFLHPGYILFSLSPTRLAVEFDLVLT